MNAVFRELQDRGRLYMGMNKLQKLLLFIAKEVKRICEENDINYFICGGTQLGAVRHQGFIPWDDDLDIAMPRRDYERFIELCEQELDKEIFFLQTEWTEEKYAFAFSKIQLRGTEIIEDFSKNANVSHGIFVDIFPYDNLPTNKFLKKVFLLKNHIYKNLIWVKCGYGTDAHKKRLSYKMMKILGSLWSIRGLKKKRKELITSCMDRVAVECFNSDYPNLILPTKWLTGCDYHTFEGVNFRGYKNVDEYLTLSYGDYMKLPPEEDRRRHSNYEIDFGKY